MADRPDLAGIEVAHELENDGGRGRLPIPLEQAPLGQDKVHAGRLHPADGADRAANSPSSARRWFHVLDEVGGGERVALVEDLVADAPLHRQPLAGEIHAQLREVAPGGQDRLPGIALRLVAEPWRRARG